MLPNNNSVKYYKNLLEQKDPLDTLNNIRNEFVVIPTDRANGNDGFNSQRFYALFIKKRIHIA